MLRNGSKFLYLSPIRNNATEKFSKCLHNPLTSSNLSQYFNLLRISTIHSTSVKNIKNLINVNIVKDDEKKKKYVVQREKQLEKWLYEYDMHSYEVYISKDYNNKLNKMMFKYTYKGNNKGKFIFLDSMASVKIFAEKLKSFQTWIRKNFEEFHSAPPDTILLSEEFDGLRRRYTVQLYKKNAAFIRLIEHSNNLEVSVGFASQRTEKILQILNSAIEKYDDTHEKNKISPRGIDSEVERNGHTTEVKKLKDADIIDQIKKDDFKSIVRKIFENNEGDLLVNLLRSDKAKKILLYLEQKDKGQIVFQNSDTVKALVQQMRHMYKQFEVTRKAGVLTNLQPGMLLYNFVLDDFNEKFTISLKTKEYDSQKDDFFIHIQDENNKTKQISVSISVAKPLNDCLKNVILKEWEKAREDAKNDVDTKKI